MRLNAASLRALPSSLFARLVLIVLSGLVAAQLVSIWLQSGERAAVVSHARSLGFADTIANTIRVLEATEPSRRITTLEALQTDALRVALITADEAAPTVPRGQIHALIAARLGAGREIRSAGMSQRNSGMRSLDVRLLDGQWVRVTVLVQTPETTLPADLLVNLMVALVFVTALTMLALRQVSAPLRKLAQAADQLGQDLATPPLKEEGSAETRRAAQAFNRMQARIRRLVDERSRALAAVSHDLRTPLTRLRLRAELVDDDGLRTQIAQDIEAMTQMIDATLDYLRSLHDIEEPRRIDINGLLCSMVEDARLPDRRVTLTGAATAPYTGKLTALRRALQNLVDNAIKYGACAHIRIEDRDHELRIVVEDEGAGIATDELKRVTEPFYRPDASRNASTGGVGLGLSIVRDVAIMHGGNLVLVNLPRGGLSATLILPRS